MRFDPADNNNRSIKLSNIAWKKSYHRDDTIVNKWSYAFTNNTLKDEIELLVCKRNCFTTITNTYDYSNPLCAKTMKLLFEDKRICIVEKNKLLVSMCKRKHRTTVLYLIKDCTFDISTSINELLKLSCEYGYSELVKLLLPMPGADICLEKNELFSLAAKNNHMVLLKILVDHYFEHVNSNKNDPLVVETSSFNQPVTNDNETITTKKREATTDNSELNPSKKQKVVNEPK